MLKYQHFYTMTVYIDECDYSNTWSLLEANNLSDTCFTIAFPGCVTPFISLQCFVLSYYIESCTMDICRYIPYSLVDD